MNTVSWSDFEKIELRVGTIIRIEEFPEARKPAYILYVDLGEKLGIKKSSAQITHYEKNELLGKQVICVTNFPEKQIGPIRSQILVTGFKNDAGDVILSTVDRPVPNGEKLH